MAFRRVLVGVNGSASSVEALHQARRLLDDDGDVRLLAAIDSWNPIGGEHARAEELRTRAADLLEGLEREYASAVRVTTALREGLARAALVGEAKDWKADLVAVGMHRRGRTVGVLLDKVGTDVLHQAPCSVLLARPAGNANGPLKRVVVGVDGSSAAARAHRVARAAADRIEAELRVVAARGADLAEVRRTAGDAFAEDDRDPVAALLHHAGEDDLLIVGSRGLSGLRALGSVSERVAHRSRCSVLVVRE
jgi:nucleotide-binding universal stress UspA family protein